MSLTAEQIQSNWEEFLGNIETYITGERKDKLLSFYKKYEESICYFFSNCKLKKRS